MKSFLSEISKLPLIRFLSSIKLTVICLLFLFILVFWGTVYQVDHGLYQAQQQFFASFFFRAFDILPFPGGQLVLWVLFINLLLGSFLRLEYHWTKSGIVIIHLGLLTFFIAAFATFHLCEESNLTLIEGESSNVSSMYHNWEIAFWKESGNEREVVAYDADKLAPGQLLDFSELGVTLTVESYYSNCNAYGKADTKQTPFNDSGIKSLRKIPLDKEPEKNTPGGIFIIKGTENDELPLLLYGREESPTKIETHGQTYYAHLRLKHLPLPFSLKLLDFRMAVHPGTQMASSYESEVEVHSPKLTRKTIISMNKPLRYKDFTFYQASYRVDQEGREISTMAVVKNAGQFLPYISTFLTFFGLLIHFSIVFAQTIRGKV